MTEDIKRIAREHLVEHGSAGLSLRAVARDLGVVSSAVYRYFASRDELLTALIVDAFDAVGLAAEEAAADRRGGFTARWSRVCRSVRSWALANPHDYALVYGSPVPGYQAPADTVSPALRVTVTTLGVVLDGVASGEVATAPTASVARPVHTGPRCAPRVSGWTGRPFPDEVLARSLLAWTGLLGHLGCGFFGHLHGGISDYEAFFDHQVARWSALVAGTAR